MASGVSRGSEGRFLAERGFSTEADRLCGIADIEFRNHVPDRLKWQVIAIRDMDPLRKTGDMIVALIAEEIEIRRE